MYNQTMLERVVKKLKKSKKISRIIIATSSLKSDDKIEKFCKEKKIEYFRGSINNVYHRFIKVIKNVRSNNFIRISGDSPLIDYKLVDKAVNIFLKKKPDLVTNTFPRSYPQGQSVEVVNCATFLKFFKKIKKKSHKEHITKYFYENFKKNQRNFEIEIKNEKFNICINEKIFSTIEKNLINYIEVKTENSFKAFIYEK